MAQDFCTQTRSKEIKKLPSHSGVFLKNQAECQQCRLSYLSRSYYPSGGPGRRIRELALMRVFFDWLYF